MSFLYFEKFKAIIFKNVFHCLNHFLKEEQQELRQLGPKELLEPKLEVIIARVDCKVLRHLLLEDLQLLLEIDEFFCLFYEQLCFFCDDGISFLISSN
jgi:hypothetical protein